jgi:endonuclease-3
MVPLAKILDVLVKMHGEPNAPPACGPFELVMWENACYLLTDERRREVFEGLKRSVGMSAGAIGAAADAVLMPLAQRGGMRPETRVFRWREIARITQQQFGGDLDGILERPYAEAKRALKQFPNIGDPGAEKILLLCGVGELLPLESNGLRVLVRLGRGRLQISYGAMYRSVQDDVELELSQLQGRLLEGHLLLREHGRTLCKDKAPMCEQCTLRKGCAYAAKPDDELGNPSRYKSHLV